MADQSQSLTWVMAKLSTVLSSMVLPWWQEERVSACQRKASALSWRVTASLTFLSVWLSAEPFIDTEMEKLVLQDVRAIKEAVPFLVFFFFLILHPVSLTALLCKLYIFCCFLSFFNSEESYASGIQSKSFLLPFKPDISPLQSKPSSLYLFLFKLFFLHFHSFPSIPAACYNLLLHRTHNERVTCIPTEYVYCRCVASDPTYTENLRNVSRIALFGFPTMQLCLNELLLQTEILFCLFFLKCSFVIYD